MCIMGAAVLVPRGARASATMIDLDYVEPEEFRPCMLRVNSGAGLTKQVVSSSVQYVRDQSFTTTAAKQNGIGMKFHSRGLLMC